MIKIINDLHAGVRRQGGTTPASRAALNNYVHNNIKNLLTWAVDTDHLIVLGDIFDKTKVTEVVLLDVYLLFLEFLKASSADLILVRGNHDSKSELVDDMCSLELLYNLLVTNLADAGEDATRVQLVWDEPMDLTDEGIKVHIIPHMFNQEAFDNAIANVTACDYLMLHCNFDCGYAVGDHSLNLTREKARLLLEKITRHILIAHEHQYRSELETGVIVLGNQFPTSIEDCKENSGKRAWVIYQEGIDDYTTWIALDSFSDCTPETIKEAKFIRVGGTCKPSEFAQIVRDIAEYRKKSAAFVISNAVKVEVEERTISKEDVTKINVLSLLLEAVPEQFKEKVRACI